MAVIDRRPAASVAMMSIETTTSTRLDPSSERRFDPASGVLWLGENGDDAFAEINRVLPGMNGGWVQIAGPVERIAQFAELIFLAGETLGERGALSFARGAATIEFVSEFCSRDEPDGETADDEAYCQHRRGENNFHGSLY